LIAQDNSFQLMVISWFLPWLAWFH